MYLVSLAYVVLNARGGIEMAYQYSKGWFIAELKKMGIKHHPVERRKLELYKTHVLRNLYKELQK